MNISIAEALNFFHVTKQCDILSFNFFLLRNFVIHFKTQHSYSKMSSPSANIHFSGSIAFRMSSKNWWNFIKLYPFDICLLIFGTFTNTYLVLSGIHISQFHFKIATHKIVIVIIVLPKNCQIKTCTFMLHIHLRFAMLYYTYL